MAQRSALHSVEPEPAPAPAPEPELELELQVLGPDGLSGAQSIVLLSIWARTIDDIFSPELPFPPEPEPEPELTLDYILSLPGITHSPLRFTNSTLVTPLSNDGTPQRGGLSTHVLARILYPVLSGDNDFLGMYMPSAGGGTEPFHPPLRLTIVSNSDSDSDSDMPGLVLSSDSGDDSDSGAEEGPPSEPDSGAESADSVD